MHCQYRQAQPSICLPAKPGGRDARTLDGNRAKSSQVDHCTAVQQIQSAELPYMWFSPMQVCEANDKPSTFQGFQSMHLENKARIRPHDQSKGKDIKRYYKKQCLSMVTLKTEKRWGNNMVQQLRCIAYGPGVFDARMEDDNWSGVLHQLRTQPSNKHMICKWQKTENNTVEKAHTYSLLGRTLEPSRDSLITTLSNQRPALQPEDRATDATCRG